MISATAYRPVGDCGSSRPSPAFFFMMDHLLTSRKESGFPSNARFFDEDVNVYLAGILTSHVFRGAADSSSAIFTYDLPLFEEAASQSDPRRRFDIYRINADHLLLRVGIFDNPTCRRPCSSTHMELTRDAYIGRGKAYYRMAWACAAETFRRPTAIGDIMGKLSAGFENYVGVLSLMRSAFLNIIPRISDGGWFHLERSILEEDRKKEAAALYDNFLDAWSDWKRTGSARERAALESAADAVKKADPSFEFEIPERPASL